MVDREFEPTKEELINKKIYLNNSSTSENVPNIERQIHIIKEIVRVYLQSFTFKNITKLILVYMLMICALWLYKFTPKGLLYT